ncbi:MAG: GtrA family protein [Polyangiaceae bacterium]|nr:GtrA family protein [Polyangiaceae bacterium]
MKQRLITALRANRCLSNRPIQEATTLAKASVSSVIATIVDGIVYQAILAVALPYGMAAFVGAALGGVTNFTINRWWAFANTNTGPQKSLGLQAFEYALTCLATYAALQICLLVLIEAFDVRAQLAWIPAKAVAWLAVSYPVQRFVVFGKRRKPR